MRTHFYLPLFLLAILSIAAVKPASRAGPGLVGPAFVLDGDGDFVYVPHDPALNLGTGDFTVGQSENLALWKPVRASTLWLNAPPQNAVDGLPARWQASSHAPQWLEVDLQRPATVTLVRLVVHQYRAGETVHQLWGAGPGEELRLLHEFRGFTEDNQVLNFQPEMPLANVQLIRVLTTESPALVAWQEIEVYGDHDGRTPGISTLEFDVTEYAGQTVTLELIAEGDDIDYAGMFVNAVHVQPSTSGSDPCAVFQNCEFDDMANDTAWQKSGRLRYTNLAGESSGSWWSNDHSGGFWHDAGVSQTATFPADASTLVVEVCTSCQWSSDGSVSPMEYNSRLSVKIDGRYLADHADPLPAIDAFPPFKNLALGQPVSASRSLPEAPPENAVDGMLHRWIAGSHPPQWIEIDLGQPVAVALVRLVVDQYPAGATVHQIWGRGPDEALRLLHEFRGLTVSGSTLEFVPETPVAGLQFIRILTTKSPSWVAWTEIEVLGESNSDGAPDLEQSDDRGNAEDEYVASPPSGNPAPGQPVTVAPALPEAPPENPVNTQTTVQLLYPRLTGAFIELQAEPLRPGLWTRMQWQDAEGGWHNIEGWQGSFNEEQRVSWWVGEEHLGEGPFRWLVYESQEGDLLVVSESFSLPSRGGEVLQVAVSLPETPPEKAAAGVPVAAAAPSPASSQEGVASAAV